MNLLGELNGNPNNQQGWHSKFMFNQRQQLNTLKSVSIETQIAFIWALEI